MNEVKNKKCIAFVVNTDWFFKSHRLSLATQALEKGYEVHLITNFSTSKTELEKIGIITHQFNISRSGINPFLELVSLIKLKYILKSIKPTVVHLITNKCVLYGGASLLSNKSCTIVGAIAGLGYLFKKNNLKTLLIKKIVLFLYKKIFSKENFHLIIQNKSDRDFFVKNKLIPIERTHLILGSGINLNDFSYKPENNNKIVVSMISRLIKDKGVYEFVEAAKMIKKDFPKVTFWLVGTIDPGNPNSLTEIELNEIKGSSVIEHLGFSQEIPKIMQDSNIVVFPSYYGEGLPKVIIEASASGRAIVTTDNPGCLEAVIPDKTALIAKMRDIDSLVKSIKKLIKDNQLRNNLGQNARNHAEKNFDITDVVNAHFKIYEESK